MLSSALRHRLTVEQIRSPERQPRRTNRLSVACISLSPLGFLFLFLFLLLLFLLLLHSSSSSSFASSPPPPPLFITSCMRSPAPLSTIRCVCGASTHTHRARTGLHCLPHGGSSSRCAIAGLGKDSSSFFIETETRLNKAEILIGLTYLLTFGSFNNFFCVWKKCEKRHVSRRRCVSSSLLCSPMLHFLYIQRYHACLKSTVSLIVFSRLGFFSCRGRSDRKGERAPAAS